MRCGTVRQGRIDLLQLAQEPLRFGELIEDRVVRLRKLPGNGSRQFDQSPAVAGQPITSMDLLFLVRLEFRRGDLLHLVPEQVELLFANGFRVAQCPFLCD